MSSWSHRRKLGIGEVHSVVMAPMPSWVDYLPDIGEERRVVDEAVAKTTSTSTPFDELAAEAVRLLVLANKAMDVMHPHRDRIARAVADLSGENVFGILAAANVLLIHGIHISGHSVERELECLTALAARPVRSQPLAFAALGVGRTDLVSSFSDDRAIAALARGHANAFAGFVAEFPTSDAGYAELGFVARAYMTLVEHDRPDGIADAARWLHRTVHEGPQPVFVRRLREPIPSITPTWISLHAIHGLWGGVAIDVAYDGTLTRISREAGGDPTVTTRSLTPSERTALENALASTDPRAIVIPTRTGVPDETLTSLTYVSDGQTTRLWKWDSDAHAAFDTIVRHLRALAP